MVSIGLLIKYNVIQNYWPDFNYSKNQRNAYCSYGRLARWRACEIGEAKEELENELWRRWSNGRVATSQLILQPFFRFSYVTGSPGEPPKRYYRFPLWKLLFYLNSILDKINSIKYLNELQQRKLAKKKKKKKRLHHGLLYRRPPHCKYGYIVWGPKAWLNVCCFSVQNFFRIKIHFV